MALHEQTEVTHLAYRFKMGVGERLEQRRLMAAVEAVSELRHPHLLPIEQFTLNVGGGAWIVAPFTGNLDGLVTLSSLAAQKGGRMGPGEVERVLLQLLEAMEFAHASGHVHGPIGLDEVLVDPRGSVVVELYGLRRRLSLMRSVSADEAIRDEVRSVASIGYQLLCGVEADEPRIPAARLVAKLDARWDEWFEQGLDPTGGFTTAGEAATMLPQNRRDVEVGLKRVSVRGVLQRFRRALRA